ncbi:MAG TPA: hypothetical protein VEL74_20720 [Thermoanaerobaculia bacterium]|nr:hypothetical protein [Thermoanaerobaculia bacterium]
MLRLPDIPPQPLLLRLVLLGASNLQSSFPRVVHQARRVAGGPVEVVGAFGHGRSYGAWSRFLFVRQLPGILQCGLWEELERRPPLPTVALVTDVGNDLAYGERPETIAEWVETCLDRLARLGAETVLTLLPIESLAFLSPLRYYLARTILFPGRGVPRSALLERANELNSRLQRLGLERGVRLVEPEVSWYGIDPVHIRRGERDRAWGHIVSHWGLESLAGRTVRSMGEEHLPLQGRRALWGVRAAELRLFGRTIHTPQPAGRFEEGTTIALY